MKRISVIAVIIFIPMIVFAAGDVLITENFENLSNWKEVFFQKIPNHTNYTAAKDGNQTFLRTESNFSASVIIYKDAFNPYEYPHIRWRWKVDNVLKGADLKSKETDDSPIRLYVAFEYNPKKSSALERALYNSLKLIYGAYPPHSSLNYVWASEASAPDIITSSYTRRSRMIILQKGAKNMGIWVEEKVDILADYRKAFGKDPPEKATIGIMNDSDNTKGAAVSYVTAVTISR